ncbi:MAG: CBS domain-containing protein [Nitrospirota bacterium]|jgi:tRNA nucleotidyltransferase (CCA-adding enzyme)
MDIIVSHINADFDAYASMVAARRLYPGAKLVFPGSQEKKLREFISEFHPAEVVRLKDLEASEVDRIILVDTKSPDRIGKLKVLADSPGVKVHLYDHHPHKDGDLRGVVEVIEEVGSTATIFAEIFKKKDIHPTPMEATLLMLGIYEETGNLLFPSTTERDMRAAAWLLKHGASLRIVSAYMKTEISKEEVELLNELVKTSKDLVEHGVRIRIAKASRGVYFGDAAHLAHRMMDMEDIDAIVLLLRMEGKVVMIGRSRAHEFDVAEALEKFGGGGHPTAASATVKEQPLEILEEQVVEVVRRAVRPMTVARDVMTRPVISIEEGKTVKDAESMMTRYGVNVLPIVKRGRYRGVVSRETVEKAIFHGFRKSPVMDFANTDFMTAEPDTPQREIERMMIEHNQRFMPVLREGAIMGAITRTDLLRAMYEDYLRKSRISEITAEEKTFGGKNLGSLLKDKYPEHIFDILKTAGRIADGLGYSAFLVGGSVRDLLRGEKNLDIDIVIEGDGVAFAKELASSLGARINVHERFATAKIRKDGTRLDVATARTEYYETPAALPRVKMSSIKKDLYRRDFTINTLAVKLNPRDFGQLVDFFGGQRDLKDKTIRVLHNLSFVEDPTRAFRAVRFAERFGFKLSKQTHNLIKSALKMDLFDRLSGSRLYEEICLTFEEAEPFRVVKRFDEYGLLKVVLNDLALTEELENLLVSVHETLLWFALSFQEDEPDKRVLYLMALLSQLKDEQKKEALERLDAPPRVRKSIIKGSHQAQGLLRRMPLGDPASIFYAMSGLELETVLAAMASTKDEDVKKEISRYFLELRKVKTSITGEDLKRLGIEPGPVYSEIFREIMARKLRGELKTKEDEERFVKDKLTGLKAG